MYLIKQVSEVSGVSVRCITMTKLDCFPHEETRKMDIATGDEGVPVQTILYYKYLVSLERDKVPHEARRG